VPARGASGFPELLPAEQFVEQQVIDRLRATFELHGFAPVETAAVESVAALSAKGEVEKEVYVLRRLHAEPGESDAGLGLHFDLTVPFARYVLDNAAQLDFPFRRYQIQKVWRGERPQVGRYREFTQADIDVIDRDHLAPHHDAEVARVMAEALAALGFLPRLRLQVNNRKLMQSFFAALGAQDVPAVLRAIDRLDKVPAEVVRGQLVDAAGLTAEQAEQCLRLADIRGAEPEEIVARVRALDVSGPGIDEGLSELVDVLHGCAGIDAERVSVQADLRIARGLDYYTGTVFETRMDGFDALGSICSGGRYDALASDGKVTYPGVGISVGLTRMLLPLFADGLLAGSRSVPSAVLVALPSDDDRARCTVIAQALRSRGIATEVAASAQKYGKQIRTAERRGIPFVWFPGSDGVPDQVRDIRTGEQVDADATRWLAPTGDLHPQPVTQQVTEKVQS
jgi:histidyl-tRNA synthetase